MIVRNAVRQLVSIAKALEGSRLRYYENRSAGRAVGRRRGEAGQAIDAGQRVERQEMTGSAART